MSKSKAFTNAVTPVTSMTRLPGAQALDDFGSRVEPDVDGQDVAAEFSIAARPVTSAAVGFAPVSAVWVHIDAGPSPALQDSVDRVTASGLHRVGLAGVGAAGHDPTSGPISGPLALATTDPVFGAAVLDPFG
jgi:hypothetical protein